MTIDLASLAKLLPPHDLYPADLVVPITPRIEGRSFFPGGCGLAFGFAQTYPRDPIMIVGQDFAAAPVGVSSFEDWLTFDAQKLARFEASSPTWRGVETLATDGLLDLDRAFFTNALLGARRSTSDTGRHPAWNNQQFVQSSVDCLVKQIVLLQPTTVVAIGIESAVLLALRFGLVPPNWETKAPHWPFLDRHGLQFVPRVEHAGLSFAFASCVHPSYQHLNSKRRSINSPSGTLEGFAAHRTIWQLVQYHDRSSRRSD